MEDWIGIGLLEQELEFLIERFFAGKGWNFGDDFAKMIEELGRSNGSGRFSIGFAGGKVPFGFAPIMDLPIAVVLAEWVDGRALENDFK